MPDSVDDRLKAAETEAAIAEAERKAAESRRAKSVADAAAAATEAEARRSAEKAEAEHSKSVAEAAKAEAEARRATDAAERELANANENARRESAKADAEARKASAEADSAAIKALLPDVSLKPLEGTVAADANAGAIAETVAYALLKTAAAAITEKVRPKLTPAANAFSAPLERFVSECQERNEEAKNRVQLAQTAVDDARQPTNEAEQGLNKDLNQAKAGLTELDCLLQAAKFVQSYYTRPGRVLIVESRDVVASDWQYHSVRQQLSRLNTDLESLRVRITEEVSPPQADEGADEFSGLAATAGAAVLAAIPKVVGAAADVAGYFQSNYAISGHQLQSKAEPMLTAIAGALAQPGAGEQGAIEAVVIDGFQTLPATTILRDFDEVLRKRWGILEGRLSLIGNLAERAAAVDAAKGSLEEYRKQLSAAAEQKPPNDQGIALLKNAVSSADEQLTEALAAMGRAQGFIDAVKEIEERVDSFVVAVSSPQGTGSYSTLAQAVLREALHEPSLDGRSPFTYILYVSLSSLGGEVQTRERRFFAPVQRYVGTCTFSVILARSDGQIEYAGSESLIGQLTFQLKKGVIGRLEVVSVGG